MEETLKEHLYALIICGGAGTRLWPRSRQKTPKQFLEKFYGEKTLFNQTVERAKLLTDSNRIFVITLADYADEILQQSQDIPSRNIIIEPIGKNTAMAIGVGSSYIRKIDPEAIIMNFWSDAAIGDNNLFVESLSLASRVAKEGNYLVDIGLKPAFPHTGLGYIEAGEEISLNNDKVYKVNSFKEKPDLSTAQDYLAKGNFYWNTGIYVWSVKAILEAFSRFSPAIYNLLVKISEGIGTSQEREIVKSAYDEVENLPIDIAVSEKADNLVLVPTNFSFSDVGDWKVAYDLKEKDAEGNVLEVFGKNGWHLGIDTKNTLVEVEDRLVATIGVENLVIIETKDAILVCSKDKAQDVKKIVNSLKEKNKSEYL